MNAHARNLKNSLLIMLAMVVSTMSNAQTPQSFSYQAVARDASGVMLVNQNVSFRFRIMQYLLVGGNNVYSETHTVTTDQFGIAHLNVGGGTVVFGNFATINWSDGPYFIAVEMDPAGGTDYQSMGGSQLLSVPYALHAGSSDLPNTGVSAGSYGNASNVGAFTVDAKGRLTAASNSAISIDASQVSSGILSAARIPDLDAGKITTGTLPISRGGTGATTESAARINLGATILGGNLFTLSNPSAISFMRINADNSVSTLGAADFRTAIGVTAGGVAGSGAANQVAYWSDASTITGSSGFTWNGYQLNITPTGVPMSLNTMIRGGNTTMTGWNNIAIGPQALANNTSGSENTALGFNTLILNTTGYDNTGIGNLALRNNTEGFANAALGWASLYSNTLGNNNTAIGNYSAYYNNTGQFNTAQGAYSLYRNSSGSQNVAIGYEVARYYGTSTDEATLINNSVFIGYDARPNANSQTNQIVIGHQGRGLGTNTTRIGNSTTTHTHLDGSVSIGATTTPTQSLHVTGGARITSLNSGVNGAIVNSNSTGVLGFTNFSGLATDVLRGDGTFGSAPSSGWSLTGNIGTVDGTNFIGTTDDIPFNFRVNNQKAGRISSGGQTIYGYQAGNSNTSATSTAIGHQALYTNTTSNNNTAIGYRTLYALSGGSGGNVAVGFEPLVANTSGDFNIALGYRSLYSNTTGQYNTAVGTSASFSQINAQHNVSLGFQSLYSNTANYNVSIGSESLFWKTAGAYNVALGYRAGRNFGTGTDNLTQTNTSIFIGYDARPNANNEFNQIVIGNEGRGLGSNTTRIGNSSTTQTHLDGNVSIGSTTAPASRLVVTGSGATSATSALNVQNSTPSSLLFIRNDGNVGIGATDPAQRLDVNGRARIRTVDNAIGNFLTISGTGVLQQRTPAEVRLDIGASTVGSNLFTITNPSAITFLRVNADNSVSALNAADFRTAIGVGSSLSGSGTANYMAKWTAASTLGNSQVFDDGTNVGIGTATPAAKLDVSGAFGTSTTAQRIANTSGVSTANIAQIGFVLNRASGLTEVAQIRGRMSDVNDINYKGELQFLTSYNGSDPQERMRITSEGNIWIGTAQWTVYNQDKARMIVRNYNTDSNINTAYYPLRLENWYQIGPSQLTGIEFWNGTEKQVATARIISQRQGGSNLGEKMIFQTQPSGAGNPQPTTKMVIENNGNVGIGIDEPKAKLHITGPFSRNPPVTVSASTYTVSDTDNWLIFTYDIGGITVTLPTASSWPGRELMLKSHTPRPISSSASNVIMPTGSNGSLLLPTGQQGAWCTLVSNGTNWVVMQQGLASW